ncbi:alpha-amylase family glycosyl hydrolase [Escherichia coli]|nr:alpha-amylase family glycosyl hydrolase [Enterobacter ludwigii]
MVIVFQQPPRYASATALASCYFLMKGTPFIYQGQEIGMVNHQFTSLDEFNDVSARNLIQKLSQQGQSDADILALLNQVSRDHSRLPMQWNAQDFAGFSEVQPWFSVNQQYADINVEQQQNDPNSILSFYKQLIALRKSNVSLVVGRYQLLLPNDPNIYAYQRVAQDMTWTIITNLSPQESIVDIDRMQLGELMLDNQNINNEHVRSDFIATQIAPPYAAYIFARKH